MIPTRIRALAYGGFQKFHMTVFFGLGWLSSRGGIPLQSEATTQRATWADEKIKSVYIATFVLSSWLITSFRGALRV